MPDASQPETVIHARDATRIFGPLTAVNKMNLEVNRGEIFGFLGPNGAGKSTLLRMLVGLLSPSGGNIDVLGHAIPQDADSLRPKVGYMTQKFSLYEDLSVAENLEFAAEIFGLDKAKQRERIRYVIDQFGLKERIEQRPATLSGGWKQRLALAAATVHEPELLFLDEPTAGVDPDSRRMFWGKLFDLASDGVTILVSTHYMDEAVRCHRLCLMCDGQRRAVDTPHNLMAELEGRIVEMIAQPTDQVLNLLGKKKEVVSATQMGNRLHLLLEQDAPSAKNAASQLTRQLKEQGFKVEFAEAAEPNLEDVFVALTHPITVKDEPLN